MKRKIAVYSGAIPSTTFIERVIVGLSLEGSVVYLFGNQDKKISYQNPSICIKSYSDNRLKKTFFLLKYSLLLVLFKKSEKKILDLHIDKTSKNKILSKIKYYPVLWYRPDVFHLQWAKGVSDWMWVQDFGIKLVVSLRGAHINYTPIAEPEYADLYKIHFPEVDGFHAVSKAISYEAEKYGANPEKIKVVYSGLPEQILSSESRSTNKTFQILSIGRNHWKKGYHYALDAMKLLHEKEIDFHYTIIGAQGVEELEFQRSDLGLTNHVSFKSNVPYSDVQQHMHQTDLLLLPSVEEGIANVVLEAMQLGTVVLTTDCGGMNEVIKDGENGFIVPVRSPQKIADAMLKIYSLSKDEKQRIIKEALVTIQQQHTETKMVLDMLSLYQTVLQS